MYKIQRIFNYWALILLQLSYAYLGYNINLKYKYNDGWEFLIGILVTTILMNILDNIFCEIAYRTTGFLSKSCGYNSSDRKIVHWFIRVLLYIIVYVISITPLCSIILTPIVQFFTREFMGLFNKSTTDFSNALLNSVTKQ